MQDSLALELIKALKNIQVKDGEDGKDGFCFPLNNMFSFVADEEGNVYYYINEEGETSKKLLGNFNGKDGIGINGLSAYEIAQKNGFQGTEKEWLESLKSNSVLNAELILLNNFENYGEDYQTIKLKKFGSLVVLSGLIKGGASSKNISVLPFGFRPSQRLIFVVHSGGSTGRIDILPNGEIFGHTINTEWISLSGIQFVVD